LGGVGDAKRAISLASDPHPLGLVTTYLVLARYAAATRQQPTIERLMAEAKHAAAKGKRDEADVGLSTIIVCQAELISLDDAIREAHAIAAPDVRQRAMESLAGVAHHSGNPKLGSELLAEAIAMTDQADGSHREILAGLRRTAMELHDRDNFLRLAPLAEKAAEREGAHTSFWANHALDAAAFDQKAMFKDAIERAAAAAPAEKHAKDRAEGELYIAAAYARAGDRAAALRWVRRSRETLLQDDYGLSEAFNQFCHATIDVGLPKLAVEDAKAAFKDVHDVSYVRASAAVRLADDRKFDDAWKTACDVQNYPIYRLRTLCGVAQRQVAAGQAEQALRQIAALDNPHERAAILLSVALRLLGMDRAGDLKVLRMDS
jgi:hypothetical protein